MQENAQQSRVVIFLKKIWPAIYRIINSTLYFILSIIKNIFNGIISQIKGM